MSNHHRQISKFDFLEKISQSIAFIAKHLLIPIHLSSVRRLDPEFLVHLLFSQQQPRQNQKSHQENSKIINSHLYQYFSNEQIPEKDDVVDETENSINNSKSCYNSNDNSNSSFMSMIPPEQPFLISKCVSVEDARYCLLRASWLMMKIEISQKSEEDDGEAQPVEELLLVDEKDRESRVHTNISVVYGFFLDFVTTNSMAKKQTTISKKRVLLKELDCHSFLNEEIFGVEDEENREGHLHPVQLSYSRFTNRNNNNFKNRNFKKNVNSFCGIWFCQERQNEEIVCVGNDDDGEDNEIFQSNKNSNNAATCKLSQHIFASSLLACSWQIDLAAVLKEIFEPQLSFFRVPQKCNECDFSLQPQENQKNNKRKKDLNKGNNCSSFQKQVEDQFGIEGLFLDENNNNSADDDDDADSDQEETLSKHNSSYHYDYMDLFPQSGHRNEQRQKHQKSSSRNQEKIPVISLPPLSYLSSFEFPSTAYDPELKMLSCGPSLNNTNNNNNNNNNSIATSSSLKIIEYWKKPVHNNDSNANKNLHHQIQIRDPLNAEFSEMKGEENELEHEEEAKSLIFDDGSFLEELKKVVFAKKDVIELPRRRGRN